MEPDQGKVVVVFSESQEKKNGTGHLPVTESFRKNGKTSLKTSLKPAVELHPVEEEPEEDHLPEEDRRFLQVSEELSDYLSPNQTAFLIKELGKDAFTERAESALKASRSGKIRNGGGIFRAIKEGWTFRDIEEEESDAIEPEQPLSRSDIPIEDMIAWSFPSFLVDFARKNGLDTKTPYLIRGLSYGGKEILETLRYRYGSNIALKLSDGSLVWIEDLDRSKLGVLRRKKDPSGSGKKSGWDMLAEKWLKGE